MLHRAGAAALLSTALRALAGEYYVTPEGAATWTECVEAGTPCSLDTANARVEAGDTVHLQAGTYASWIEPARSGRPGEERIVYRAAGSVEVTGTRYAIHLDSVSWISVEGIEGRDCEQFLVIRAGHYNEIDHCRFEGNRGQSQWMGSWVHDSSTHNRIHHCTFARFGWVSAGD
ncbi:MAG: hypothetical protein ABIL09_16315, partial [Gemmatimonadota bacterium]